MRIGAGYDSNIALAAGGANRRSPEGETTSMDDGEVVLDGVVVGRVADAGSGLRGLARFDLDGRVYGRGDTRFGERLSLAGELRLPEGLALGCGLEGQRLDITLSDDDAWTGGLECGVRWALGAGFELEVAGGGAVKAYDEGQLDGIYSGRLRVGLELGPLLARVGLVALGRESSENAASRTELVPEVSARLDFEHGGGEISYRAYVRWFRVDSRSGSEHAASLSAWWMPLSWLGVYAEVVVGGAEGGSQALVYERVEVHGGLRLRPTWDAAPPPLEEERGPARPVAEGVRFRFVLPDATEVSVIGSFNGWDPDRGRLTRGADGAFSGRFDVAPGRHEYHLLVDGEPRRPPGAARYVHDDFGSENAVLRVAE